MLKELSFAKLTKVSDFFIIVFLLGTQVAFIVVGFGNGFHNTRNIIVEQI